jgi:molybdopterin converting factor subunit 1
VLPVILDVLLFASYAEALGANSIRLDMPEGARVRDVIGTLRKRAGGTALPPLPLVAVNQSYAAPDLSLSAGDEVAVIPPVAGG